MFAAIAKHGIASVSSSACCVNLASPTLAAKMKEFFPCCGAVAQLGERIVRNDEATGSIPVSSTIFPCPSFTMTCELDLHSPEIECEWPSLLHYIVSEVCRGPGA